MNNFKYYYFSKQVQVQPQPVMITQPTMGWISPQPSYGPPQMQLQQSNGPPQAKFTQSYALPPSQSAPPQVQPNDPFGAL